MSAPDALQIVGAQVVLPDRVAEASVRVEAGRITSLDGPADGATQINARGQLLAPAMIDIHGDAFERQLMPRPGVFIPMDVAVFDTDRQIAAAGIATAYHSVTLGWEPGLRDLGRASEFIDALARLAPRLAAENRVQLRWETFCFEAHSIIEKALQADLTPTVAFNDHTSLMVLPPEIRIQERPFELSGSFPVRDLSSPEFAARFTERAKRSGVTPDEFAALVRQRWSRRGEVPGGIEEIAAIARARSAPMFSHDDSQTETREFYRSRGARISEFPMRREVAQSAREAGDWIVLGGPNAARGGSHLGSMGAADMIADGLCDILASDYYYPSLLAAVARLVKDGIGPLHEMWKQVSQNPAEALGLTDRGRIEPGKRADLVLVDWPEGETPSIKMVMSAGRKIFTTQTP